MLMIWDSTTYQVLDASDVGTGAVWMTGGGACAVLANRQLNVYWDNDL